MKKSELQQIIKEEIYKALSERDNINNLTELSDKPDTNMINIGKRFDQASMYLKAMDTTVEIKDLLNMLFDKIQSLNKKSLSDTEITTALMSVLKDLRKPKPANSKSDYDPNTDPDMLRNLGWNA